MKRRKIVHTTAIGLLCFATLTTNACVTQSSYDTAAADLEGAKAELQSARIETQGLIQQVNDLQQRQIDLAKQKNIALSALQQATREMKAERTASQKRLNKLNHTIQHLVAQQKSLRYQLKRESKEEANLQLAVDNYTSKLGSIDELRASPVPSPGEPSNTALVPPAQTPVPNESALKPTVTATAAPVNPPASIPKPQPPRNQPPEPVEEDWLTFLQNWIASLWKSVVFF